jgi:hypothetical protein
MQWLQLGPDAVVADPGRTRQQAHEPFARARNSWHYRRTEQQREQRNVKRLSLPPRHIPKVQCQHHRHPKFQQLNRQIEVPLQLGRVHYVNDHVRLLPDNEIPSDGLLGMLNEAATRRC